MKVSATVFQTRCSELLDRVARDREEITITKRGKPLARLVPVGAAKGVDVFGCLAGTVTCQGDIVSPVPGVWDAVADKG